MSYYIETKKLWAAQCENILRLAKALELAVPPDNCDCHQCRHDLINRIVRTIQ